MLINLRRERERRMLKQKDVAQALNVAVSTYSYWEMGKREPDIASIKKLAKFFDASIDYILTTEDDLGNEEITVSEKQGQIINLVMRLNSEECNRVKAYIDGILDIQHKSK